MTEKPVLPRPEAARYYEEQCVRQLWIHLFLWIALVAIIVSPWLDGLNQPEKQMETFLTMGIGGVAMLLIILGIRRMRMRVWVMEDAIQVRYWPLIRHKIIPLSDIEKLEAVEYRPIAEYGGWGLRGLGANRAFNVSGNKGVRFWFKNGNRLLIGSQDANAFANSVRDAMR